MALLIGGAEIAFSLIMALASTFHSSVKRSSSMVLVTNDSL